MSGGIGAMRRGEGGRDPYRASGGGGGEGEDLEDYAAAAACSSSAVGGGSGSCGRVISTPHHHGSSASSGSYLTGNGKRGVGGGNVVDSIAFFLNHLLFGAETKGHPDQPSLSSFRQLRKIWVVVAAVTLCGFFGTVVYWRAMRLQRLESERLSAASGNVPHTHEGHHHHHHHHHHHEKHHGPGHHHGHHGHHHPHNPNNKTGGKEGAELSASGATKVGEQAKEEHHHHTEEDHGKGETQEQQQEDAVAGSQKAAGHHSHHHGHKEEKKVHDDSQPHDHHDEYRQFHHHPDRIHAVKKLQDLKKDVPMPKRDSDEFSDSENSAELSATADEDESEKSSPSTLHPDDDSYYDDWDGESHTTLEVSRGHKDLKTPHYRLPFAEGQHDGKLVIGSHNLEVKVPKVLEVRSEHPLASPLTGQYEMMTLKEGVEKPFLFHGRLAWQQKLSLLEGSTADGGAQQHQQQDQRQQQQQQQQSSSSHPFYYLYYDYNHHTWVFDQSPNFTNPQPLAFVPHGAALPITRSRGKEATRYGIPSNLAWRLRRESDGTVWTDNSLKINPIYGKKGQLVNFHTLNLHKVFHAPEEEEEDSGKDPLVDEEDWGANNRKGGDSEEYMTDMDDFPAKMGGGGPTTYGETGETKNLMGGYRSRDEEDDERISKMGYYVPEGTQTRQQYFTHPKTEVYHTHPDFHPSFDHEAIVKNPVHFLNNNAHPDVKGLEAEMGEHVRVPHKLRKVLSSPDKVETTASGGTNGMQDEHL